MRGLRRPPPPPGGRKARRAVSAAHRARRYEALEDSLRGGVHEVCPKFLAFKGPLWPGHLARLDGEVAFPAEHYARLFRDMGVRAVVHPRFPTVTPSDWFRPQNLRTVRTRSGAPQAPRLHHPAAISARGRDGRLVADSLCTLSPNCTQSMPPPAHRARGAGTAVSGTAVPC